MDFVRTLKEINRVSKKSFVTLAAYSNEEKKIFEKWTFLGTTCLHEKEWIEVI